MRGWRPSGGASSLRGRAHFHGYSPEDIASAAAIRSSAFWGAGRCASSGGGSFRPARAFSGSASAWRFSPVAPAKPIGNDRRRGGFGLADAISANGFRRRDIRKYEPGPREPTIFL